MNQQDILPLRLANQQLSRTDFTLAADVVTWLGAMQAQDFAGAKWSLGMRLPPTTDHAIEQAFNDGRILRTHVMRPTWHFVTPKDIRWILNLTAARVHQVNGTMYRQLKLDTATLARSADIMAAALEGNKPLSRDELGAVLKANGIAARGPRLAYIVMWAELEALVCSGPRRGKQFTYLLLDERAPDSLRLDRDEALTELLVRYFQSHGPATAADFARWSGLTLTETSLGLEQMPARVHHEEIAGQRCWFVPADIPSSAPEPAAWLMSIYDEYTIGYKDFGALDDARLGQTLRDMGNALQNVIIVDRVIVGTWRKTVSRMAVRIELNPLTPLTDAALAAIHHAAEQLGVFLERRVEVIVPGAPA